MKVTTTSVTQAANETLGTKDKTLYYLIIENNKKEKLIVNVGQKTHDKVKSMEEITNKQIDIPEELKGIAAAAKQAEEEANQKKGGKK